jgi:hypothetical protein
MILVWNPEYSSVFGIPVLQNTIFVFWLHFFSKTNKNKLYFMYRRVARTVWFR